MDFIEIKLKKIRTQAAKRSSKQNQLNYLLLADDSKCTIMILENHYSLKFHVYRSYQIHVIIPPLVSSIT